MPNQYNKAVSVVIPSLGGEILKETIQMLNNGTIIPSEIILCVPKIEACRVEKLDFFNLRVVITEIRGQVAQRSIGFKEAKENIVLQLDDDILLERYALEVMVNSLVAKGVKNVVGPIFYNQPDYEICAHRFPKRFLGWVRSMEASLLYRAPWGVKRMGIITPIGVVYGVDPKYLKGDSFQTEWLPGGCVLSYKQDLILEPFYPFPGKAYGEDVIHSILRSRQKMSHSILPQSKCSTEIIWNVRKLKDVKKNVKVKQYIMGLLKSDAVIRYRIWCFLEYTKELLKKISGRPGSFWDDILKRYAKNRI
jgi:glycosyltransferase involved in cell wall biosynthesis